MPAGMYLSWLVRRDRAVRLPVQRGASCSLLQVLADVGAARAAGPDVRPAAGHPAAAGALPLHASSPPRWRSGGPPGSTSSRCRSRCSGAWRRTSSLPAHPSGAAPAGRPPRGWSSGCSSTRRRSWCSARFGIVALAYFATGGLLAPAAARCGTTYRPGVVVLRRARRWRTWSPTPSSALNFSPGERRQRRARRGRHQHGRSRPTLPAVVGGPLALDRRSSQGSLADAGDLLVLVGLRRHRPRGPRDRTGPARAACAPGWLPAFFLGCDVVLVARRPRLPRRAADRPRLPLPGRARRGHRAGARLRHACRSSAPSRPVEPRPAQPARSTTRGGSPRLTAVVVGAGRWSRRRPVRRALAGHDLHGEAVLRRTCCRTLERAKAADPAGRQAGARTTSCGRSGTPTTCSATCSRRYADRADFPTRRPTTSTSSTTTASVVPVAVPRDPRGRARPARGLRLRRHRRRRSQIPLDGPVAYGGWWVRHRLPRLRRQPGRRRRPGDASYSTVDAGRACTRSTSPAATEFDSVEISGAWPPVSRCAPTTSSSGDPEPTRQPERRPVTFRDRTFPTLNAVRARGRDHGRAHPRGVQHRPDQRRLGRRDAGPLRLRRDALLRPVRASCSAGRGSWPPRSARTSRRPGTTCGSARCGSCRSTGSWSSSRSSSTRQQRRHVGGLGQPPDPHPALPPRPAGRAR